MPVADARIPGLRVAWRSVPAGTERRPVAWALLRELAGTAIEIGNACPRCGGPHGPVVVTGSPLLASVAYAARRGTAETVAVVAVADAAGIAAIGIDAEFASDPIRDAAGGIDDMRGWVRLEAALKADGRGLRVDPAAVTLHPHGDAARAILPGRTDPVIVLDVPGPPGVWTSIAAIPTGGALDE